MRELERKKAEEGQMKKIERDKEMDKMRGEKTESEERKRETLVR